VEAALKKEKAAVVSAKSFNADTEASKMITGLSYLIEEQRADKIYLLYNALKKTDKVGFAISRTNPKLIQRTYKADITEFMWLTDRDVGGDIRSVPPSLESIIYYIEEFIDKYPDGVILMDGLEYLIGNNTFNLSSVSSAVSWTRYPRPSAYCWYRSPVRRSIRAR